MFGLGTALYRSEQVRALDRAAIDDYGVDGYGLMQQAAAAALHLLQQRWPRARRIVVVAGTGNNGGDGIDLARQALAAGLDPVVCLLGDAQRIADKGGEAAQALAAWQATGEPIHPFDPSWLRNADVVIDAMLGSGLDGQVRSAQAEAIAQLNNSKAPVLALDIPSGLHGDTGAVLGAAVRADVTASFIGQTPGLFMGQGATLAGDVVHAPLDLPEPARATQQPIAYCMSNDMLNALPARSAAAHKGQHGHVLIVGGNYGMPGAAVLATQAALRAGAGLVTVATRPDHVSAIVSAQAEAMVCAVENIGDVDQALSAATVVAIGPGLGQDAWAKALLDRVLAVGLPTVFDADALNLLAQNRSWPLNNAVITPHPGEAARLLACDTDKIQQDRFAAARELAALTGAVAVLKGQGSLIATADAPPAMCAAGNPGMAVGGMGDVLTGVIAALIAQGFDLPEAARLAVLAHAVAGDRAAETGQRGLLPSDVIAQLRAVLNS
ncbi:NAD(P)H-hydrate dehydratase [bacterium]|nr:NAD(P)H-hydrate dehydratase [bacterium]